MPREGDGQTSSLMWEKLGGWGQHCRGPARLPAKGRDHLLDLRFCVLQSLTSISRVAGVQ